MIFNKNRCRILRIGRKIVIENFQNKLNISIPLSGNNNSTNGILREIELDYTCKVDMPENYGLDKTNISLFFPEFATLYVISKRLICFFEYNNSISGTSSYVNIHFDLIPNISLDNST